MQLVAEVLSTDLSVADEAGQEQESAVRIIALDQSSSIQKLVKAAFPGFPWQATLQEIRRDRAIIDRPA